jgi:hypothetical protein
VKAGEATAQSSQSRIAVAGSSGDTTTFLARRSTVCGPRSPTGRPLADGLLVVGENHDLRRLRESHVEDVFVRAGGRRWSPTRFGKSVDLVTVAHASSRQFFASASPPRPRKQYSTATAAVPPMATS